MHTIIYTFVAGLLAGQTRALVPRASLPPKFSVEEIGIQSSNFPDVYRDGGGGGTLNGLHLITFSDTTTTTGGIVGSMKGFTDNTIAYVGQNGQPINKAADFGSNGVPGMPIPFTQNETQYTTDHFEKDGLRCVLWPQGSIATLPGDGNRGVAIYPIGIYGTEKKDLYNTLVEITADPITGPSVERVIPQLFYEGEAPLYGVFSTIVSHESNDLYLFSSEFDASTLSGGMRVAKVSTTSYTDRSQYQYWDGASWSTDLNTASKAQEGLLFTSNLSTGDVFWSNYYNTYMVVYFNSFADSTFYMRYALEGTVTGKWSEEIKLFATQPGTGPGETYNYAGHAYPTFDASGKTLTLSYTMAGGALTDMLKVTFE
ncbi:hypothetical protein N0V90_000221 [Kalmusia sp. IMI 367209]|nr:hypothetical protein N0V90_000221 [Kalmusia sp. IMI 367209]